MTAETIKAWLDLALGIAAIIAVVVGFVRWGNRSLEAKILNEIRESTRQIQPNANGGLSLADVAKGVRELRTNQIDIGHRLNSIDEKFTERMDTSDAMRERIMEATQRDREAWADLMQKQGIIVPDVAPIEYKKKDGKK